MKKELEDASQGVSSSKEIESLRAKITQVELVAHQEAEKEAKNPVLTSENMYHDGFQKTVRCLSLWFWFSNCLTIFLFFTFLFFSFLSLAVDQQKGG